MNDFFYSMWVRIIRIIYWRKAPLSSENLPRSGPAVFICNHLEILGAIGAICSLNIRMFPWIIADMLDSRRAANYLRWDFVERSFKLKPPFSQIPAWAISRISVPLLRSIGCIAVNRGNYRDIQQSLIATIEVLKQNKIVIIYPEDPNLELDPQTKMRPFMKGFTRLGELFYQETGQRLQFYPIAVHETKSVMLGEPLEFDPANPIAQERLRLRDALESRIMEMYLQLAKEVPSL